MIIKQPAVYDVSHWKIIKDFKLIDPKPLVFITKATEAYPGTPFNNTTDPTFIPYFKGAMEICCIRGAFHFFRKDYDTVKQANHFLSVLSKVDILPTDLLILDFESGGEKASQLWQWHEIVKKAYPDNLRINYSRKNIFDAVIMTQAEKEYFKNIFSWTAGYPYFPDLFSTIPKAYTPDQGKYGPNLFWQYSAHGRVNGITTALGDLTDVDLNLINPLYIPLLGSNEIGEAMDGNWEGKANQIAKLWVTIGGERVYYNGTDLKKDVSVEINWEGSVSGTKYIRLTSPVNAYSKAEWFDYHVVSGDSPPPPSPTEKKIVKSTLLYDDNSTEDLFPVQL